MDKKLESVEFGRSFRVDNLSYGFGSDDDGASNFVQILKVEASELTTLVLP